MVVDGVVDVVVVVVAAVVEGKTETLLGFHLSSSSSYHFPVIQ